MNILILDQHTDVTKSFLQQFNQIGHSCWIADNSLALVPEKYTPEKLQSYNYGYPYQIGNRTDLQKGEYDCFVAITKEGYSHVDRFKHKRTKGVFGNAHFISLASHPSNVLSFESRALKTIRRDQHGCLFVLSLNNTDHTYHGINPNGDYIQLIYDFKRFGNGIRKPNPCYLFGKTNLYKGKRKVLHYGDEIHAVDTEQYPKMYAQLHLKNWGSGNDFAILKGMSRGIPPILFEPYIKGSITDNFINDNTAFLFKDPDQLPVLLEQLDDQTDIATQKGKEASLSVRNYMNDKQHLANLEAFFNNLR